MRKIIVLSFITIDGVMQAPGGPEEDVSGGFKYGGWMVPYGDEFISKLMSVQMSGPYDLLLGRKTFEIWASYWPFHRDQDLGINQATKYVVSRHPMEIIWENTVLLHGDIVSQIKELKAQDGPDIQVQGSSDLIQTLLKHDLVDELWLKIFPLTLGQGKRLFAGGPIPAAFELIESNVSPKGVIVANYRRAGRVRTGGF